MSTTEQTWQVPQVFNFRNSQGRLQQRCTEGRLCCAAEMREIDPAASSVRVEFAMIRMSSTEIPLTAIERPLLRQLSDPDVAGAQFASAQRSREADL